MVGTVESGYLIKHTDDDSLLNKEIPKNLGEISLVIGRGEMVMKPRAPADNRNRAVLDDAERLHERSKKVTVHRVGQVLSLHRYMDHSSRPSRFGRERARERNAYKRRLIRNSQPEITFVFKYRPLGTFFYLQTSLGTHLIVSQVSFKLMVLLQGQPQLMPVLAPRTVPANMLSELLVVTTFRTLNQPHQMTAYRH